MIPVIIPTCDSYSHLVEALQLSLKKYGLTEKFKFFVLGYRTPHFEFIDGVEFISLGEDLGSNNWSTKIVEWVSKQGWEFFIFGNDDCALTKWNHSGVLDAISLFNHEYSKPIGRIALTNEGKDRLMGAWLQDVALPIQFHVANGYTLSLGWSIWNTKCFLEFCKPHMSPWKVEISSLNSDNFMKLSNYCYLTYFPDSPVDAAYFKRKNVSGIVQDWDKGYYGHDLEGDLKEKVCQIIFNEN